MTAAGGDDIDGTIHGLREKLDIAVERTVELHRSGGHEEAVLAETAVAVGAAKALEILTGESLETQLERREEATAGLPDSDGTRRRRRPWLRRGTSFRQ